MARGALRGRTPWPAHAGIAARRRGRARPRRADRSRPLARPSGARAGATSALRSRRRLGLAHCRSRIRRFGRPRPGSGSSGPREKGRGRGRVSSARSVASRLSGEPARSQDLQRTASRSPAITRCHSAPPSQPRSALSSGAVMSKARPPARRNSQRCSRQWLQINAPSVPAMCRRRSLQSRPGRQNGRLRVGVALRSGVVASRATECAERRLGDRHAESAGDGSGAVALVRCRECNASLRSEAWATSPERPSALLHRFETSSPYPRSAASSASRSTRHSAPRSPPTPGTGAASSRLRRRSRWLLPAARGHERRRLGPDLVREPGRLRGLPRAPEGGFGWPRQLRLRRPAPLHPARGTEPCRERRRHDASHVAVSTGALAAAARPCL